MPNPAWSLVRLQDLGGTLYRNATTKLLEVFLSQDIGNRLSKSKVDAGLFSGVFKADIVPGSTQPVPADGLGAQAVSTGATNASYTGVGFVWSYASDGVTLGWNKINVTSAATAGSGDSTLPPFDATKAGFALVVDAQGKTIQWINLNPLSGPIDGWAAGAIAGGIG